MEEIIEKYQNKSKRKSRILQSAFARLRRKTSKFASKKHRLKIKRESEARIDGIKLRLPKQKRRDI